MTDIVVTGPDGVEHVFPAETQTSVIQTTLDRHYGKSPEQKAIANSAVAASAAPRRSLWSRFTQNAEDVFRTSAIAESYRAGRLEGAQHAAGELSLEEIDRRDGKHGDLRDVFNFGNPVRSYGRAVGSLGVALQPEATLADAKADEANERQRRKDFEQVNANGDSFLSYAREGDYGGFAAHGLTALAGTLVGSAMDPVSYISGGRTILARTLSQSALAGAADWIAQDAATDVGTQEDFSESRLFMSAAAGGGFSLVGDLLGAGVKRFSDRLFRSREADMAAELDAYDDLALPALSEREVAAIPDFRPSNDNVRVVTHPETGEQITLRGGGSPIDQVEGGVRPGDYVEGDRIWRANQAPPASPHGPSGDPAEAPRNPQEGGGGGDGPPPRDNLPANPAEPAGPPPGDGTAGWDDVDWGKRRSPERAQRAVEHLDNLKRFIKPEHVESFVRLIDEGVDPADDARFINKDWVDWDSFNSKPEELLGLTNAFATIFADLHKGAGVKVQTHAQTRAKARQMGAAYSDIIKAHADVTGEGGLAWKVHVSQDLFAASVDDAVGKMKDIRAKLNSGVNATDVRELAELVQRTAVLGAMDASISNEIGRALQARQMRTQPGTIVNDLQAAFDELNAAMGTKGTDGLGDAAGVAKVVDDLLNAHAQGGVAKFNSTLRKMRKMGFWDYVGYAAVGNLLSGIPTHVKNMVGSPTHALFDLSSRLVAGGLVGPIRRTMLGDKRGSSVDVRETLAYMEGNFNALGEAFRLGLKGFIKGAPVVDGRGTFIDDQGGQVPFAFSRERLQGWLRNGISLNDLGDMAGVLYFETIRTLGFRPSVAADEFNKALARRGELHALALRRASEQSAKAGGGKGARKVFEETRKGIIEEPTAEAIAMARSAYGRGEVSKDGNYAPGSDEFGHQQVLAAIDARQLAVEHAQLVAFQQSGELVESVEKVLRRLPIVKHFAANFVRTPTQLLVAAFRDYNPVTGWVIVGLEHTTAAGQARHKAFFDALRGDEEALRGGGAAAEMVIARQVVGAGAMAAMWGWWSSGSLVGQEVPEGPEYAGVLPYSVKLPDGTWVQYTGFSPVAELLGLTADFGHLLRVKDLTDDQEFSVMGALAVVVRNNVLNKSFMTGLSDFMELLEGGSFSSDDPNQTARNTAKAAAGMFLGRAIPASSFLRRAAQDGDPVVRDARTFMEQLQAYLPNLSETLAAKRDFMGRPVLRQPGETGMFQAAKTGRPKTDPLEVELHFLTNQPSGGMTINPSPATLDGQRLTADEHNRLIEIQGQLWTRNGLNMEDALRELIATPDYLAAGPDRRMTLFKDVISAYREGGKKAAFNPDSPLFMADTAKRIGPARLKKVAKEKGWDADQAFWARGHRYGLQEDDLEEVRGFFAKL